MDILADRYELVGRIDTGTKADIRLANDLVLEREVAVKIISTDEPGWQESLRREAKIASKLEHPNVLPVYDFGIQGEIYYLVMRVFTETLAMRLARSDNLPFDSQTLLLLARPIASAIDYIHEKGQIIHGNLKPQNILLDEPFRSQIHPYLSDFGVAAVGAIGIGTPMYMAPEQLTGIDAGPAVDLYAFGITLYQCFCNVYPLEFQNTPDLYQQKISPPPGAYSVRKHRPELPAGVDVVLDRLTRAKPSERYPSAIAAIDELTRVFYSGQTLIEGKVFVSYARQDQAYVHQLAAQLRNAGVDLWIDQDISPGENWDNAVEQALHECNHLLLVVSPASMTSENVHDEWSYFLEQGKPVLPFIYQSCEMSFRLRRRQYVTSTGDLLNDIARIVDTLAGGIPTALKE